MIFTPEEKIEMISQLLFRETYYEQEIAKFNQWRSSDVGQQKIIAAMLELAYMRLSAVRDLINKIRDA